MVANLLLSNAMSMVIFKRKYLLFHRKDRKLSTQKFEMLLSAAKSV
jgi:hypothetical protein